MTITVVPVTPSFAAEIGDIDLSGPVDEDLPAIKEAFTRYAVLVFPDQHLSQEQHLDFARQFGPLELTLSTHRKDTPLRLRKELRDASNLDHSDEVWAADSRLRAFQLGSRLWHTDSSFKHVPARASLLYARSVAPIGGRTEFADMRAAYDALSENMKCRLNGLIAEHSIFNSRARFGFTNFDEEEHHRMPPVPQAVVRRIPESGRQTLYIASHAGSILGIPKREGRALIDELLGSATQPQFIYSHRWRLHDVVMWDNRCTMHRGTEYDDLRWRRDLQRATVSDVANSCEQEGIVITAERSGPPAIPSFA